MSEPADRYASFPPTSWSLVGRAGIDEDRQRGALNELLEVYWPALRTHLVVRKRLQAAEADDLVQSFIENKVLERDLIHKADSQRGRFRTFLLTALDNYLKNERQKQHAAKRAADRASSYDADDGTEPVAHDRPDAAVEIEWGKLVLSRALERMQSECGGEKRSFWEIFYGRILAPILDGAEPLGYDQIVEQFGFATPAQASNALMTAKRMFARSLRSVVSEYVDSESELESELKELQQAFSQS